MGGVSTRVKSTVYVVDKRKNVISLVTFVHCVDCRLHTCLLYTFIGGDCQNKNMSPFHDSISEGK
jgi:hypothetical protein